MERCTFERLAETSARCSKCGRTTGTHGIVDLSLLVARCRTPLQFENVPQCPHRGKFLETIDCKPCESGGRDASLFQCLHFGGECTLYPLRKRKPDGERWRNCQNCIIREQISTTK